MHNYRLALIGKKFGKLTVVSFIKINKWGQTVWNCQCECGNSTKALISPLKSGLKQSCGCLSNLCGSENANWEGVGEIGKSFLTSLKSESKKHNREFDLTLDFLWKLFLKQDKKCALSGIPLIFGKKRFDKNRTASLDRIDSSKGYTKENVQWTDKRINFMKQQLSVEEFKSLCQKVSEHSLVAHV